MVLRPLRILVALLLALPAVCAAAAEMPVVAIIIDDIGHRPIEGRRAVALPGPVACAVLPHTPHGERLSRLAHRGGKEVILHLPLEATRSNEMLGPGAIRMDVSRGQLRDVFLQALASVPHASGVNNHMGSLLTRHPGHMAWLMSEISEVGDLFFVDSVTTEESVAFRLAIEHAVDTAKRDVFLDPVNTRSTVVRQFDELVAVARRRGTAIGIGHPLPATMDVLERLIPELDGQGIRLVSVAEVIRRRAAEPMPSLQR